MTKARLADAIRASKAILNIAREEVRRLRYPPRDGHRRPVVTIGSVNPRLATRRQWRRSSMYSVGTPTLGGATVRKFENGVLGAPSEQHVRRPSSV